MVHSVKDYCQRTSNQHAIRSWDQQRFRPCSFWPERAGIRPILAGMKNGGGNKICSVWTGLEWCWTRFSRLVSSAAPFFPDLDRFGSMGTCVCYVSCTFCICSSDCNCSFSYLLFFFFISGWTILCMYFICILVMISRSRPPLSIFLKRKSLIVQHFPSRTVLMDASVKIRAAKHKMWSQAFQLMTSDSISCMQMPKLMRNWAIHLGFNIRHGKIPTIMYTLWKYLYNTCIHHVKRPTIRYIIKISNTTLVFMT